MHLRRYFILLSLTFLPMALLAADSLTVSLEAHLFRKRALTLLHTNPDSGIFYAQTALTLFEEIGSRKGRAEAHRVLGIYANVQGEFEEATAQLKRSLQLFTAAKDRLGMAKAEMNLGAVPFRKGNLFQALHHFEKALPLLEEMNHKEGLSATLSNIGLVYSDLGEFEKAIDYQKRSAELEKGFGPLGYARALDNIGLAYANKGDFKEAVLYHEEAMEIFEKEGDSWGLAYCYGNYAIAKRELGDLDGAEALLNKALVLSREIGDPGSEANNHIDLAEVYLSRKQYDKVLASCKTGMEVARRTDYSGVVVRGHKYLAQAYTGQKQTEKAMYHFEQYAHLNDSLSEGRYRERMFELENKLIQLEDSLLGNEMNMAFQKEALNKKAELEQSESGAMILLVAGLGFLLTIGAFLLGKRMK